MGILDQVTKTGKEKQPHFVILNGVDGVGKTTWVRNAPGSYIVGPENGVKHGPRASANSWEQLCAILDALATEQHPYTLLGIDSGDWIEALLWKDICEKADVANIEAYEGGWGKGYVEAVRRIREELLPRLERLRSERKMHVVIITHSFIKTFTDPQLNQSYDRYILKLNEKAAAVLREAATAVLFVNFKTNAVTDKGKNKARAFGDGRRVMYTERRPAFDAKNRDNLPFEIEFGPSDGWKQFYSACEAGNPDSTDVLKKEIENLLTQVKKDDELYAAVTNHLKAIGDDAAELIATRDRLQELLQQK